MGSKEKSIVAYERSRSRSRSKSRSRRRSRSKSGIDELRTIKNRQAVEKIEQKRLAKEQATMLAKAADARVETAQQALDTAIQEAAKCRAAELEAEHAVQEAIKDGAKAEQENSIQKLVDERQDARKARDFDKSDRLREELRSLGVTVNDEEFSWTGPDGSSGQVKGGNQRRAGDWDCPSCGMMCFASKDRCFKCGTKKGSEGKSADRKRRSPSSDHKKRRGGDKKKVSGKKRRKQKSESSYSESEYSSRSPSRRRRRR